MYEDIWFLTVLCVKMCICIDYVIKDAFVHQNCKIKKKVCEVSF